MYYRFRTATTVLVVGLTAVLAPASADASPGAQAPANAAQEAGAQDPGDPPPSETPMCSDEPATVTPFNADFAMPPIGWADDVAFDGKGGMWVSRVLLNQVQHFDPAGKMIGMVEIEGPAGLEMGPDGLLYVNQDLVGVSRAQIARFDPAKRNPRVETFASGLPGANGLAIDGDGNLYVGIVGPMSIGQVPSLVKVLADGSIDQSWSARADFANANGVVLSEDTLYVARWTDINSPIEGVPLENPATHHKVAQLTPDLPLEGGVPKVLDDISLGPDGSLYTVSYAAGEVLRVDPSTGEACVVANGFNVPTSVHAPEEFGDFDPDQNLFVTEATGMIKRVELPSS